SDFWYPFVWSGLRPRDAALDKPVPLPTDTDTTILVAPPKDTVAAPPPPSPPPSQPSRDSVRTGFTVSFAALLDESKARDAAGKIVVNGQPARVVTSITDGTAVYRVVLGPFATRGEAERTGRASGHAYFVYAGSP
ncbi:MAG: SPOR domain-containing protein, partial [Gemmatimonadaceae bacterium]